ncbi:hypothetical protein CASFOL_014564 [Castilleja foliolosa]|uniref:FAR1 domain-containing protein n=1 Tax=Castilleja foliolosa TaxID=1961234 RepID=A0ABD3DS96_9LAMI
MHGQVDNDNYGDDVVDDCINGDGNRHGNADDDSNDYVMDLDIDVNTESDGEPGGDGSVESAGKNADKGCKRINTHISPKNSKYYTPECASEYKPYLDQKFKTLKDGIDFYRNYAAICGFDARKGSQKSASDNTIIWKYVYCNREGDKNVSIDETSRERRRVSRRSKCKALIAFRLHAGGFYVVRRFIEHHTHDLCHESLKHLMKVNRNLNERHKKFVMDCARANIGPTKSFRLFKETVGGYANVGCTNVDFKNFSRDLKAFASGVDAQMLIQNLFRKRDTSPGFYFEYTVDASEHLNRLFWADTIGRKNYEAFGDCVSFDATYSTNSGLIVMPDVFDSAKDMDGQNVDVGCYPSSSTKQRIATCTCRSARR